MYYFLCICLFLFPKLKAQEQILQETLPNNRGFIFLKNTHYPEQPISSQLQNKPQKTPINFFFQEFYYKIQTCNLQINVVPYSFLCNRPKINLELDAKTKTVHITNFADVIIGSREQTHDQDNIILNKNERRYVPQIKALYIMSLKKQAETLLLNGKECQSDLEKLLRIPEIQALYVKAGFKTTIYYYICKNLFSLNMRISDQHMRNIINMFEAKSHPNTPRMINWDIKYYFKNQFVPDQLEKMSSAQKIKTSPLNPNAKAFVPHNTIPTDSYQVMWK
jgi:hypothetical protein